MLTAAGDILYQYSEAHEGRVISDRCVVAYVKCNQWGFTQDTTFLKRVLIKFLNLKCGATY
jgi:hypothetical protein